MDKTYDDKTDIAMTSDNTTHFGFETVREEEKAGRVRDVFDSVAGSYDVMNDLMSGGLHRVWKDVMVDWLKPRPDEVFLDVAGGTGDISFRIADRVQELGGKADITVSDINHEMLKQGKARAIDRGFLNVFEWLVADAENLPMDDNSVDAYTCAFGTRNMTHIDQALKEAHRVLKPGGRYLCLEFSQVQNPVLRRVYDRYSFSLLPKIGEMVAKDRDSYQYLAESIRKFPNQKTFARMIREAGFDQVEWRNMTGGIVALHMGRKL